MKRKAVLYKGENMSTQQVIPDPKPIRYLRGQTGEILTLTKTRDEKFIAGGGVYRQIHLWNLYTGEHLRVLDGHTDSITRCAFDEHGSFNGTGHLSRSKESIWWRFASCYSKE